MTIIFTTQQDALDCVQALIKARRAYTFGRSVSGMYEITTRD